jgi:16S rRNA (cytosine967-C5)-methyltransferase
VVPPAQVARALSDNAEAFANATLMSAHGLLMTPRRTGTDGFFVSILARKSV